MQNQKIKADSGKPKISLVPTDIVRAIARVREYGNNKYPEGGKDNWKDVEVERYRDALGRHVLEYFDNPHGNDEESGLPILWHIATNVAFLIYLENEREGDPWEMSVQRTVESNEGKSCPSCLYEELALDFEPCRTECRYKDGIYTGWKPKSTETIRNFAGEVIGDCCSMRPEEE